MSGKIILTTILAMLPYTFVGIDRLHAEPHANDRVALMLSGKNCPSHHQAIAKKLSQIPGIVHVDMALIDDHVMIDRIQGQETPEDLLAIVNGVIPPDGQCKAEIMQSCITAGPPVSADSK
jgi:hypothetical protein